MRKTYAKDIKHGCHFEVTGVSEQGQIRPVVSLPRSKRLSCFREPLSARRCKMNQATLEEYRCRKCGRLFYIDGMDRHPLNMDFGCPHGCDDGSERMRDIVAEIKETADGRVNDFHIRDYQIVLLLSPEEFELSMGRMPEDQEEFDRWAFFVEKGLLEGNIDWDNIRECTREAMLTAGERE